MIRALLLCGLVSTVASANEAFFKAEVVDAVGPMKLPTTPGDPAWKGITGKTFRLTPQRSVHLHDKTANDVLKAGPGSSEVLVKAAASASDLVLYLEWADGAKEVVREDEVNVFADSVAVEVPERMAVGTRLPAISMGDADQYVNVALLRATKAGAQLSRFSAAGFGSLTRQAPAAEANTSLQYDEAQKVWRAVLTVALDPGNPGLIPVAFAAWDGARGERAGYKRLSAWHFVRVPNKALDPKWVEQLAFGYYPGDLGNAAAGKMLAEGVCLACHHLPGKAFAPPGLAPSLEAVGAIAAPSYLRDSITTPSKVILHEPNPNQHHVTGGPADKNGALPNADGFRWSVKGEDGKWVSKMPPFTQFTPAQLADLIAFLKTLDGPPLEKP
ncbi:MAG: c-type cytochrome [Archangium sp.]|nr:c-type cytochrome [Archangium sp.]